VQESHHGNPAVAETETGGRNAPEMLAGINRNQWPKYFGKCIPVVPETLKVPATQVLSLEAQAICYFPFHGAEADIRVIFFISDNPLSRRYVALPFVALAYGRHSFHVVQRIGMGAKRLLFWRSL